MEWVVIVLEDNLVCLTSLATLPCPRCSSLRLPCTTDEAFMELGVQTERMNCARAVHQLTVGGICVHALNPWHMQANWS